MSEKPVKSALVSVFHKEGLEPLAAQLKALGATVYSTGGTARYLSSLGLEVVEVESVTDYPSIFGGRVKTLHPKVFGGILYRRDEDGDVTEAERHRIPPIDLVVVDLYPFERTVAEGADEQAVVEKVDIGGISLIRAAAKNFKDVLVCPSQAHYQEIADLLARKGGKTDEADRRKFAVRAFDVSSHYDSAIFNHFNGTLAEEDRSPSLKVSSQAARALRYGENPHQSGTFYGHLDDMLEQLHGKELSYNNLIDVDAAVDLAADFQGESRPFFAILKHNNACGAALADTCKDAYLKALAGDPVSAFGGVLVSTVKIDAAAAEEIDKLFMEVLIAPAFEDEALAVLKKKKNRVLLLQKAPSGQAKQFRTLLNGAIAQDKDLKAETVEDFKTVTKRAPSQEETAALLFANKLVKHSKSNTIVLADASQLYASGVGQTSRVDALKQAIEKAKGFGFDLSRAVMASDAFFPFPDCVEIADKEGVKAVVQPGGSKRDQESVDYCDAHGMAMALTGVRHFKH